MNSNPREISAHLSLLLEEFRRKGYQCREVKEAHSTIVYLIHDNKNSLSQENTSEQITGFKKFQGFQ